MSDNIIYPPLRHTKGLIIADASIPGVKQAARVMSSSLQNPQSRDLQVLNFVSITQHKIASFEPDYWQLDGSFVLPRSANNSRIEVGFLSEAISNPWGNFLVPQELVIEFLGQIPLQQIGISFDYATGNGAAEVQVICTNNAGATVFTQTITDNKSMHVATKSVGALTRRVRIVIFRTINPFRRIRISELHFGEVVYFENKDIKSLQLINSLDIEAKNFPMRRLRANLINFGRFNADALPSYLQTNTPIEYYHLVADIPQKDTTNQNLTFENDNMINAENKVGKLIFMGKYYIKSCDIKENVLNVLAISAAKRLDAIFYGSHFNAMNLAGLVNFLLQDTGIRSVLPASFSRSPVIPPFFGNISIKNALLMIAKISCSVVFEDDLGNICFVDPIEVASQQASYRIGLENMFENPKQRQLPLYNGIMLKDYMAALWQNQTLSNQNITLINSTMDLTLNFKNPVFENFRIVASSNVTIENVRQSPMRVTFRVRGTPNTQFTVQMFGNTIEFFERDSFLLAAGRSTSEQRLPYVINLPIIIQNRMNFNNEFLPWLQNRAAQFFARRTSFTVSFRQDPELKLGSRVRLFTDRKNRAVEGIVTACEFDFAKGVLSGKTSVLRL